GQCPADIVPEPLDMPLEIADAAVQAKESSPGPMRPSLSCLPDLQVYSRIKPVPNFRVWDFTLETKLSSLVK
ncbi:hypothetical protein M9458_035535, partial [Cirrhinus mrigala]